MVYARDTDRFLLHEPHIPKLLTNFVSICSVCLFCYWFINLIWISDLFCALLLPLDFNLYLFVLPKQKRILNSVFVWILQNGESTSQYIMESGLSFYLSCHCGFMCLVLLKWIEIVLFFTFSRNLFYNWNNQNRMRWGQISLS